MKRRWVNDMFFKEIKKIFSNNIKLLKHLNEMDKSRIFMTSLYWICDICIIIIYNIFLLPFLYYAIDHSLKLSVFLAVEGFLTVVLILCDVYQSYYQTKYDEKSTQKITHKYNKKIFSHIKNDDLKKLYDPDYLNITVRLLNTGVYNLTSAFDMQWWAVSVTVLGAVYISVLANIDALLIIIAVISSVFMFFINIKLNKLNYQNMVESAEISRKLQYIINIFSLRDYSQDLRTTGLRGVLIKKLRNVTQETYKRLNTVVKKICKYTYIKNIIIFAITTSLTWMYLSVKYLMLHSFTLEIADIIVAQIMMQQLCNMLTDLSTIGPGLQKNSIFINEYFQYLESESEIKANEEGEAPEIKANEIKIKNVSFSYDGEKEILHDINMKISGGEKIAIVGRNGVGKTTLVKLLLQLYRPQSGEIEMDGKSVESYSLKEYRGRFGVAFQNTHLYSVSVAENVLIKPYEETETERERITEALKKGRLYGRIAEEEKGIESTVTKEFDADGIEFSGGQVQKLALSRVFARDCGIVILDEPSASLDPVSEAEMYESMLELMKEKTVILISHRLSACRKVDRIYVLEDGKIAEEGTHSALLEKGGIYADMWHLQADGYIGAEA